MNTADVVRRVQRIFGDNNESQIYVSDILDWINDGQVEIVRQAQCLQSVSMFTPVSGTAQGPYALPANFLFERRVTYQDISLTKIELQEIDDFNVAVDKQTGSVVDIPQYFYIWGTDLYLNPVPGQLGTNYLKLWYINAPPPITNIGDPLGVPLAFHEDVVRFALMRAREANEDYSGSDRLASEFQTRMAMTRDQANNQYDSYPSVRDYSGDYYAGVAGPWW